MINETLTQAIPQGYVPNYFLYITGFIILLAVILLTKTYKKNKSWGNFPYIITFSTIIAIISIASLVTMPEMIIDLVTKLGEMWANF